jgi:uncharacterized beta-barrel protein YwiB (DUF1934 family)
MIENEMNGTPVVIDIDSVHGYDQEDSDRMEFTTDGTYTFENGVGRLSYWESEVTGLTGTLTQMEIAPGRVIVRREGTVTSQMEFAPGNRSRFAYETPYGTASMGMDTRQILSQFDERGGQLEMDYVLDLEHMTAIRNKFCVRVRRADEVCGM